MLLTLFIGLILHYLVVHVIIYALVVAQSLVHTVYIRHCFNRHVVRSFSHLLILATLVP